MTPLISCRGRRCFSIGFHFLWTTTISQARSQSPLVDTPVARRSQVRFT
jgi:hypothetical protein